MYQIPSNVLVYGRQVTGAVLVKRITASCKNGDRHRAAARSALCQVAFWLSRRAQTA